MIQKITVDTAITTTAISTPWWMQYVAPYLEAYVAGAVAVVVTLRVLIIYREWRKGKRT